MQNPLVGFLTPGIRQQIYAGYAFIGLLLGATQVGFSAAALGQPTWLTVVLAIFAFIGTALGATAASNVQTAPATAAAAAAPAPAPQPSN